MSEQINPQETDNCSANAGSKILNAILGTALLIPLALAAWHQSSPQQLPELQREKSAPALLFSTYMYQHGPNPIESISVLKSEFRFRNDGDSPVHIEKIERSCGCMNPMLSTHDVNPDETASLMVPISTVNEQPGPKEFMLTVHYTDPRPQEVTLTIKAVFPKKMVVVEPQALYLSQRTSTEVPFSIRVSDFRDESLAVKSVFASVDFVDTKLIRTTPVALAPAPDPAFKAAATEAATVDSQNSPIQTVGYERLEAATSNELSFEKSFYSKARIEGVVQGNLPPGRHQVLVAVETDDPKFPFITVPMWLTGPSYPVGQGVEMTSSAVKLVASENPRAQRSGNVAFTAPAEWQFDEPRVWPEQLKVTRKTNPTPIAGRASTILEVALTGLPPDQLKEGIVTLPTTDGKNLVTVKILFHWP